MKDSRPGERQAMDRDRILTLSALCLLVVSPLALFRGHSTEHQIDKKKCPTVEVTGPRKSKGLKDISYRARIKNFSVGARPILKWSLTGGQILGGQGTDSITVQPNAYSVKSTLVVENFPVGCQSNTHSLVTEITEIPYVHLPPIVSIVTSVSSITRPCSAETRSDTCPPSVNEVALTADATLNTYDHYLDRLVYTWSVTAGRLKGEGKTVVWDLSGVASGTYKVTVEVGYFALKGTETATVKVSDCADCKAP
jgi:hypothetical protein